MKISANNINVTTVLFLFFLQDVCDSKSWSSPSCLRVSPWCVLVPSPFNTLLRRRWMQCNRQSLQSSRYEGDNADHPDHADCTVSLWKIIISFLSLGLLPVLCPCQPMSLPFCFITCRLDIIVVVVPSNNLGKTNTAIDVWILLCIPLWFWWLFWRQMRIRRHWSLFLKYIHVFEGIRIESVQSGRACSEEADVQVAWLTTMEGLVRKFCDGLYWHAVLWGCDVKVMGLLSECRRRRRRRRRTKEYKGKINSNSPVRRNEAGRLATLLVVSYLLYINKGQQSGRLLLPHLLFPPPEAGRKKKWYHVLWTNFYGICIGKGENRRNLRLILPRKKNYAGMKYSI